MSTLFADGRIVDLILVLVVLEAAALMVFRRRTGRGVAPGGLAANLLAGAFLLLALRCSLAGAGWMAVAACLGLSLLAHVTDLRIRWQA